MHTQHCTPLLFCPPHSICLLFDLAHALCHTQELGLLPANDPSGTGVMKQLIVRKGRPPPDGQLSSSGVGGWGELYVAILVTNPMQVGAWSKVVGEKVWRGCIAWGEQGSG